MSNKEYVPKTDLLEYISDKYVLIPSLPLYRFKEYEYNNQPIYREVISHNGGVAVLAIENDEIYFVEQYRHAVESNVLENEADRIRAELFDCGNRCRRGIRLHPEEMEHIRVVFTKYSQKLKQNGTGEAEYDFICDYYNRQDFPEYHTHN